MRTPKRLQPGDTIGILSTSSPTTEKSVEKMKRYFEQRGYRVKVAPHTLANFGFLAGKAEERAADFNAMLHDPAIRMIVTANGGAGAEHLLPLIDYPALKADPKMVVGLSNPSLLLNALTRMTGVPTFHGPNGVNFGDNDPTPFAEENFWPVVSQELEFPYVFPVSRDIRVVRGGGPVEGRLVGGHLKATQRLIGTPWEPEWRGAILLLEEFDLSLAELDLILTHFKHAGALEDIRGLVFGRPVTCEPAQVETAEDILLRVCQKYGFPIISNVRVGHTDEKITLPIGCQVGLDTAKPAFTLLEPPTC